MSQEYYKIISGNAEKQASTANLNEGDVFEGEVKSLTNFGAFVEVVDGIQGSCSIKRRATVLSLQSSLIFPRSR